MSNSILGTQIRCQHKGWKAACRLCTGMYVARIVVMATVRTATFGYGVSKWAWKAI